jgi:hypothetical protein
MGISAKCDTSVDLKSVKSVACGLLGSSAIADDKTLFGEQQDWIGWMVDAAAMTVSISARNLLKTIHAFFGALDVSAPVSLQVVERMASLSSRYAMLCVSWHLSLQLYTAPRRHIMVVMPRCSVSRRLRELMLNCGALSCASCTSITACTLCLCTLSFHGILLF